MEEIYKRGLAKAIGVSNYTITHLEEMKRYATIMPAVDQVEFHPFLYQKELLKYCKDNNIVVEAYRPLTKGTRLNNKTIEQVAHKYGKTDAQILIRWSIQHSCIPIPKSVHKERIEENIKVFDFEISGGDMKILDGLNENLRLCWDPTNLK
jgi:diketogulonate reductase-like aldo/keto reductase